MLCRRVGVAVSLAVLLLVSAQLPDATRAADAEPSPPALDAELIAEALEILGERYVDEEALNTENLTAGAIRGIVEALGDDGHTEYLTPEEYAAAQDALDGRVVGIGVVLDQRSRTPHIISVIDGSPADRSGLRAGDVISSIDGTEASRLPLDELAALVRGLAGTSVELEVERPGLTEPLAFHIDREDVPIEPASWAMVPGSEVAVVRIVQFSLDAGQRTRDAIEAALAAGACGLVIDLRGNPGGLVDEAVDVAAAFMEGGVAYQEQGREGPPAAVPIPPGRTISTDVPLVIVVDYATASSAEILAAAMRDAGRATIVGEQTYGTGTVLNTFDLSDGSAIKVGVLSWSTPAGEPVFRVGITPDHEVPLSPGAVALRPHELEAMAPEDFAAHPDLQLRRAVALLQPLADR